MSEQIKKVVVVGGGLDAWMTAFFLKSVLDKSRSTYDISLVDTGSDLCIHDFYAVLASYKMLHKTLGANDEKLRETAKANYCFAQRFTGWNPGLPEFFHAYDRHGINFNGVDFYQYWMKGYKNGLKMPLEDFSLGVAAAKHRRFIAGDDGSGFSHAAHGLHLSALEYTGALARAAVGVGVTRIEGQIKTVNTNDDETIASIVLQDDAVIEADFYIDASGPDAVLIRALSDDPFEDWGHWYRCDRMITASVGPLSPKPAFAQTTAFSSGWCGLYPLAHRTAVQVLYSSVDTDRAKVTEEVRALTGVDVSDGKEREIKCGILKRSWIGNCLAVGSTAAVLEPLDALQQHPLVVCTVLLRQLFPASKEYTNERKIYNRSMHSFVGNLRNYQLAHYLLNSRDEPFWTACRNVQMPDVLTEKIDLFKESGYVSIREDETFQEENWLSLFHGHGLMPENYSPLVDNIPEDELIRNFQEILKTIKSRIASAPLID